jgi:ElaB/YqjD/DUF883 family membrane-anchored ribosome-binding protein
MSTSSLVVRPPQALARTTETPAQVRAELEAARERVKVSLDTLEKDLGALGRWRETVRKHPVLTIGGMFAAGYLLGRLWGRR